MIEIQEAPQKAVLFGTDRPENDLWGEFPLEELGRLAETAGAEVVDRIVQRGRKVDPVTYIGKGKAEEIKQVIESTEADLAIFDDELSPSQARNLEKLFDVQVLDRTELILDIFASHACTTEARLQVELAQLQYLLPRLKNMWAHLSRIRGGIGLRGPGETQLETDRRMIKKQITLLMRKLRKIENHHQLQRAGRESIPTFALVGYTNAGKSSLLKAISGSDVLVRDQLFSTLDTTTRNVELDSHEMLISDTVGFISRLPHRLVASFKATLEEVVGADHLLVVVDVSNPHFAERIKVVENVLSEIGAGGIERTLVFNKTDLVKDGQLLFQAADAYPDAVFSSAADGPKGLKHIQTHLIGLIQAGESEFSFRLEPQEGRLAAAFHRLGRVMEHRVEDGELLMRVRMPRSQALQLVKGTVYENQLTGRRTS
jgi:GTPase